MKTKFYIYVGIAIAMLVFFLPRELTSSILILFFALLTGVVLVNRLSYPEDCGFLRRLFIGAYISRIFLTLLIVIIFFLAKDRGLLGDGWCHSENGHLILKMWESGIRDIGEIRQKMVKISVSGTLNNYDLYNAMVYYITGKSPLSLLFINCFAGSFTAPIVFYIARQFFNKKVAIFSGILTAFWPSLFFWSTQNLKEVISTLLICLTLWGLLRMQRKFSFYLLFLVSVCMFMLHIFRAISVFVICAVFLFVYIVSFLHKITRDNLQFLAVLILACLFVLFFNSFLVRYLTNIIPLEYRPMLDLFNQKNGLLNWLYIMRNYRAYGNLAFLKDFDFRTPLGLFAFAPLAFLVAWLAPFPWQLRSAVQFIALPEVILYYSLMPAVFVGVKRIIKYKLSEAKSIILYILCHLFVLAFLEGNIGTLFRHRAAVLPFIFTLAGIGLFYNKKEEHCS
jgi:hypothetical protein